MHELKSRVAPEGLPQDVCVKEALGKNVPSPNGASTGKSNPPPSPTSSRTDQQAKNVYMRYVLLIMTKTFA